MSDAVLVAVIMTIGNITVTVIARWMSHIEHKKTTKDVKQIKDAMNGAIKEEK